MGYAVPMTDSRQVDQAIAELRGIGDPYRRLRQADELDAALAAARTVVAQIRQDTIRSLRGPVTGYGTIAQRLGLTKSRIQQIANAPARQIVAAYAIKWFLLLSGVRGILMHGAGAVDARILQSKTFIPRFIWSLFWLAGTVIAVAIGGKWLIPPHLSLAPRG